MPYRRLGMKKVFETFPEAVRERLSTALTIAAQGGKVDIGKPVKGIKTPKAEIDLIRDRLGRLARELLP